MLDFTKIVVKYFFDILSNVISDVIVNILTNFFENNFYYIF
jgi:hypothetical protein